MKCVSNQILEKMKLIDNVIELHFLCCNDFLRQRKYFNTKLRIYNIDRFISIAVLRFYNQSIYINLYQKRGIIEKMQMNEMGKYLMVSYTKSHLSQFSKVVRMIYDFLKDTRKHVSFVLEQIHYNHNAVYNKSTFNGLLKLNGSNKIN